MDINIDDIKGIDMEEMERQRYKAIKKSDKYLELDILIGVESSKFGEHEGNIPVVTTEMHHCGHTEISYLYATLNSYMKMLQENYPLECAVASTLMDTTEIDYMETDLDKKKKED